MKRITPSKQFAICVDNNGDPTALKLHKVYQVLTDHEAELDGDIRIIDETGTDDRYPAIDFVLILLPRNLELALRTSFTRLLQPIAV
jgi:hypothetical protein